MNDAEGLETANRCTSCRTHLAPGLLVCPACGTLVHAEELKQLASSAEASATPVEALGYWRRAHALLPAGTRQEALVLQKIETLVQACERAPALPAREPAARTDSSPWGKIAGGAGAVGLILAKFKFALIFLLTKAKLLLLGFTKLGTLLSMLASFALYWQLWGWRFAAGFILSIYVHEMGHVAALARLGIKASAPMFIPGFGAIVRLREKLPTAREDARVGLAGPIWGLGAAIFSWLLAVAFHSPLCAAVAKVGAYINLFNLAPIWQLDGGRAWRAFTTWQCWVAASAVLLAFLLSGPEAHGVLLLVGICAVGQLFCKHPATEPNYDALAEYLILIGALTLLASVHAPSAVSVGADF